MITVRFPTGFSVQYNEANYADQCGEGWYLYIGSDAKKRFVAFVPAGALFEYRDPCRTYFAANPNDTALNEARDLRHKLELAKRQIRKLKGQTQ